MGKEQIQQQDAKQGDQEVLLSRLIAGSD